MTTAHGPLHTVDLPRVCPLCEVKLIYAQQPWSSMLIIEHGEVYLVADTKYYTHGYPYTRSPLVALREYHAWRKEVES